jgi:hypothetical protein
VPGLELGQAVLGRRFKADVDTPLICRMDCRTKSGNEA